MDTASSHAIRQKRLKAGTACTNCRRKKLRCTGTPNCTRCVNHKLECIVDEALFLKTNSAQSLYAKLNGASSSSSTLVSDSRRLQNLHPTHRPKPQLLPQNSSHSAYGYSGSNGNNNNSNHHYQHHIQQQHIDSGALSSSSSCSGDEMPHSRQSYNYDPSERRLSAGSMNSFSSQSPGPTSPYSYNFNPFHDSPSPTSSSVQARPIILSDPPASRKLLKKDSATGLGPLDPAPSPPSLTTLSQNKSFGASSSSPVPSSSTPAHVAAPTTTKKRASKDQGSTSTKPRQKRQNSRQGGPSQESDHASSSSLGSSSKDPQSSSSTTSKQRSTDLRSIVSTMSLDGHGQQ